MFPAARTCNLGMAVRWTKTCGVALAAKKVAQPPFVRDADQFMEMGRRRSQSIRITDWPAWAQTMARL